MNCLKARIRESLLRKATLTRSYTAGEFFFNSSIQLILNLTLFGSSTSGFGTTGFVHWSHEEHTTAQPPLRDGEIGGSSHENDIGGRQTFRAEDYDLHLPNHDPGAGLPVWGVARLHGRPARAPAAH